jgi:hypothetical protein
MKVVSARLTPLPRPMPTGMFDPLPKVYVTLSDGKEHLLFEYYPDEVSFVPEEFVGLEHRDARRLKYTKDVAYLRS